MNILEEHNKRVIFDMADSLEQKIDKVMVMMGNLVTKDDGQNSLNCKFIKPIEVRTNKMHLQSVRFSGLV